MKTKLILVIGILALNNWTVNAQCAIVGLDPTYCVTDPSVTISAPGSGTFSGPGMTGDVFDPALAGVGTHLIEYFQYDPTAYTVDQTGAFALTPGGGTAVFLGDDEVTPTSIPIGFSFNFFGTNYTDFYLSSNGFITFNMDFSDGCCSGDFLPSGSTSPANLIAFCWDDMYPPGGGTIEYFTTGVTPNQKLVLNFFDMDFCCSDLTPMVKMQLVLFETTNIIEIHTEYANSVPGGTQGIMDATGTIGYPVPGRNSEFWPDLANDYVAFIPSVSCTSNQSVTVIAAPTVTGDVDVNPVCEGDSVVFTGGGTDTYVWDGGVTDGVPFVATTSGPYTVTGTETASGCSNTAVVDLVVNPKPTFTLDPNDELFGSDGSIDLTILTGTGPFTFDWDNDGVGDADDNDTLSGVVPGTYTVIVTDANGCTTIDSASLSSQVGLDDLSGIDFSIHPNPSGGIFQITFSMGTSFEDLTVEIVNSRGQKVMRKAIDYSVNSVDISDSASGIYFVKVISAKGTTVRQIVLK